MCLVFTNSIQWEVCDDKFILGSEAKKAKRKLSVVSYSTRDMFDGATHKCRTFISEKNKYIDIQTAQKEDDEDGKFLEKGIYKLFINNSRVGRKKEEAERKARKIVKTDSGGGREMEK